MNVYQRLTLEGEKRFMGRFPTRNAAAISEEFSDLSIMVFLSGETPQEDV